MNDLKVKSIGAGFEIIADAGMCPFGIQNTNKSYNNQSYSSVLIRITLLAAQGSGEHQSQRPVDTPVPAQCDSAPHAPASQFRKHRASRAQRTRTISCPSPVKSVGQETSV